MAVIGMGEAARRLGMTTPNAALRALRAAGVPLVAISTRANVVEEADLAAFIAQRPPGYKGRGRPPGAKNKPKEGNSG